MNIEVVRLKKDDEDKLLELFLDCFCEIDIIRSYFLIKILLEMI